MMQFELQYSFVDFIPAELRNGILYISVKYSTASHLCCCGCGERVVTPITPTDWKIIFNGESVSLHPSIGNWGFRCRSHYFIKQNKIVWANSTTDENVKQIRRADNENKAAYYGKRSSNKCSGITGILKRRLRALFSIWR